ncbi:MAG: hypothetical protein U0350_18170 [Caldilineaceae bacterium]
MQIENNCSKTLCASFTVSYPTPLGLGSSPKVVGRTPESWLAMQANYDLWQSRQSIDLSNLDKVEFTVT